jgi:hypothetical protein
MDKESRVIAESLVFLFLIAVVFWFTMIRNPPAFNNWVDHDRWYDPTLQTT